MAAVAAVFWGVLFFGVTDLLTVFIEGQEFAQHYLVESGWGLMFLVMVAVPFGALAVRPGRAVLVWSLLASGAALVLGGLLARSLWHTVPGLAVAATAAVVAALGGASLRPAPLRPTLPWWCWPSWPRSRHCGTPGTWQWTRVRRRRPGGGPTARSRRGWPSRSSSSRRWWP